MKKTNKKGFTIVELVIVIAVIAILAAVLIPTFISLTKKANLSADEQAVNQMNKALAIYTAENGKPASVNDVMSGLSENGINAYTLTPVTQGYAYYWNPTDNTIELVGEGKKIVQDGWVMLASSGYGIPKAVSSLDDFTNAVKDSSANNPVLIQLSKDLNFSATENIAIGSGKSVILDLNGKKLTTNKQLVVADGGSLTVKNGFVDSTRRAFQNNGGTLVLNGVTVNATKGTGTDKTAVYVGKISKTVIANCTITSHDGFGIGTNSSKNESDGAVISIIKSTITSDDGVHCGIHITIAADVLIEDSVITGGNQGAYFRGCNATIRNSKFNRTCTTGGTPWSSGNWGPLADIIFACGDSNEFGGYLPTAKYACENVTADTVIVHKPTDGNVTLTGITPKYTCHDGKNCGEKMSDGTMCTEENNTNHNHSN